MVDLFGVAAPSHAQLWADRIIDELGDLPRALHTSPERITCLLADQRPAAMLAVLRQGTAEILRHEIEDRPLLNGYAPLTDYLHGTMAYRSRESARVLHLTKTHRLIRDEEVSDGSVDQTQIYVREVARRALELGSAGVILVHNHPSGDAAPSRQDIALTREIVGGLKLIGVTVHDHIVVASTGQTSFRAAGLM